METITENKKFGLNRGNLKMIALFCMTIDHIGYVLVESWILKLNEESILYFGASLLDLVLRLIGRIAFPIFCFFIAEGFIYTRNVYKYAGRLLLLAILSEVPFDLAVTKKVFDLGYQNVFFTLLTGLLLIYILDRLFKLVDKKALKYVLAAIISVAAFIFVEFIHTDYGGVGVLSIALIYLVGREELKFAAVLNVIGLLVNFVYEGKYNLFNIIFTICIIAMFTFLILLSKKMPNINSRRMFASCSALSEMTLFEASAFVNVGLMILYNGKKGKNIGWLFYFFYPVHLAILFGIGKLLKLY